MVNNKKKLVTHLQNTIKFIFYFDFIYLVHTYLKRGFSLDKT